jgi:hypothetical protein
VCEVQTQLYISQSLHFGSKDAISQAERLSADVSRLLIALMKKLKSEGKGA